MFVSGMIHVSEYYVFRNYNGDDANVTSFGAVPKYWKGGDQRYYTYFCYYRPVTMGKNPIKFIYSQCLFGTDWFLLNNKYVPE